MSYDSNRQPPRTDTTRHLGADEAKEKYKGMTEYLEGARQRSERFSESTTRLQTIREDIDQYGQDAHSRPTGVLSGGDVDIAYHYLGVAMGVLATLYSLLGSVFAIHGGSSAVLTMLTNNWQSGPANAFTSVLFNIPTLAAVVLQAILFIVMVGTRRNRQSWQHIGALLASVALTYAGWRGLLVAYGAGPLMTFTSTIPAALIGGALGWLIIRGTNEGPLPRTVLIGVIAVGVVVGALGVTSLIYWIALLLAWSADQIARRIMVLG